MTKEEYDEINSKAVGGLLESDVIATYPEEVQDDYWRYEAKLIRDSIKWIESTEGFPPERVKDMKEQNAWAYSDFYNDENE